MIRMFACLVLLWAVAACGVDGEPVAPTVTGAVSVGSNGNVHTGVGVGLGSIPVSIRIGV